MDILRQRLQEALEENRKIDVCTGNSGWIGVPTYVDDEYVEVLSVIASKEGEGAECTVTRWIVRINKIHALAILPEVWDAKRLAEIPTLGKESPRE